MGYRQLEHTADVALEIWAESEEELLREGAHAVVELLVETEPPAGEAPRRLQIDALDPEDRLVRWLNEILALALGDGYLVHEAELSLAPPGSLQAELRGHPGGWAYLRTELKSVTYHDLRLWHDGQQWRAQVVIDV